MEGTTWILLGQREDKASGSVMLPVSKAVRLKAPEYDYLDIIEQWIISYYAWEEQHGCYWDREYEISGSVMLMVLVIGRCLSLQSWMIPAAIVSSMVRQNCIVPSSVTSWGHDVTIEMPSMLL